ncbi:MAG: hypothetical protein ACO3GN_01420 [Bacteroidia bacterium]
MKSDMKSDMKLNDFLIIPLFIGLASILHNKDAMSQSGSELSYAPPTGLTLSYADSAYRFSIGGFVQPTLVFETDSITSRSYWNARRAFFVMNGMSRKEKVGFSMQADFSQTLPLMDAFVFWKPSEWTQISFGQKQSPANNREMLYREDALSFTDRSMLSRSFSRTGREFGLFMQSQIGTNRPILPFIAITSGDGRNSFGVDSRDNDQGGWKYGGRLDWYPLGKFSERNMGTSVDISGESELKILTGLYGNLNRGASDAVGEGHNVFALYDTSGTLTLPDYRKWGIDFVAKYKGVSVLYEYQVASADLPAQMFADASQQIALRPGQIATFLALGKGWNIQGGYFNNGWGLDLRLQQITPEFNTNGGKTPEITSTGICAARHLKDGSFRFQISQDFIKTNDLSISQTEFMLQMRF